MKHYITPEETMKVTPEFEREVKTTPVFTYAGPWDMYCAICRMPIGEPERVRWRDGIFCSAACLEQAQRSLDLKEVQ
ncbi:MAG: hypothetical protein QMD32_06755 [Smithellaceae bacterium]|nr:hypothetical protein [Smithellaceae bacterium]